MIVFIYLLVIGYLGYRAVRAIEKGQGRPSDLAALAVEVELLRDQHEQVARQIASLREGQEFVRELGRHVVPPTSDQ